MSGNPYIWGLLEFFINFWRALLALKLANLGGLGQLLMLGLKLLMQFSAYKRAWVGVGNSLRD